MYYSEDEIDKLINALDKDSKKLMKFQTKLRTVEHQYYEIQQFLEPYFENAIKDRVHISKTDEETVFTVDEQEEE